MWRRNFRRSGSSRRRFGSFRSRSRMQTPHQPRRWERANIYLPVTHIHDAAGGSDILTILVLAQIYDRLFDPSVNPAGSRSLNQAVRYLEIGGIVGSYSVVPADVGGFQQPTLGDLAEVHARMLLCSDRLDNASPPVPASLTPNWFTNTQPIATVAELQDDQQTFPTQIHHQEYWHIINSGYLGVDLSGDLAYVQVTERATRSISQRLRLRLSDNECLVLHCASHLGSITDENRQMALRFTFVGTLFYRFVFGRG